MAEADSVAVLIAAYLDQPADAAVLARLDAALCRDPSVARRLALATLQHQHLRRLFGAAVGTAELEAPRSSAPRRLPRRAQRRVLPPRRGRPLVLSVLVLATLACAALLLWPSAPPAAAPRLVDGSLQAAVDLRAGDALVAEVVYDCPHGASVQDVDGSDLRFAAGSRCSWQAPGRWQLLEGGVLCTVRPQQPDGRFVIASPALESVVVGTAFRLQHDDAGSRLVVSEGAVRCRRLADDATCLVAAGFTVHSGSGDFAAQSTTAVVDAPPPPAPSGGQLVLEASATAAQPTRGSYVAALDGWQAEVAPTEEGHARSVLHWRLGETAGPLPGAPLQIELEATLPARAAVQVVLPQKRDGQHIGNLIGKRSGFPAGRQELTIAWSDFRWHSGATGGTAEIPMDLLRGTRSRDVIVEIFGTREPLLLHRLHLGPAVP